jgi:hypothetical protein
MLSRLKKYIDFKGISTAGFERSIGMSNASFGKSLKNGGTIGADKLEIILKVYPDLNVNWLISGRGEMLLLPGQKNESPPNYGQIIYESQEKIIQTLQETIDIQQRYIKLLEKDLTDQKAEENKPAEDGQKRKAG